MEFPKLTDKETRLMRSLCTPRRIQDYLGALKLNRAKTLRSPRRVIETGAAHCIEGALLASAALWFHGQKPLLLDIQATARDLDHVVALFRKHGYWGAISKTSYPVLRYREPVYKTVRELAMSYFHEYFLDDGVKTMRTFSEPFDLSVRGQDWITSPANQWDIGALLDDSPHTRILTPAQRRGLRPADALERRAGMMRER